MSEDELRFIRSSIGMLARQLRELVGYVSAVNEARGATTGLVDPMDAREVEEGLLELDTSLLRLIDAFPPEAPGGRNGG